MISKRQTFHGLTGLAIIGAAIAAPTSLGRLVGPSGLPAQKVAAANPAPQQIGTAPDTVATIAPSAAAAPHAASASAVDAIAGATAPKPAPSGADGEQVLAYARDPSTTMTDGNPVLVQPPAIVVDATGLREAIAAYRDGDLGKGDEAARTTTNEVARTAAEWAALRLMGREAGFERITTFLDSRPDWPAAAPLRRRAEEILYQEKRPAPQVRAYFARRRPESPFGKLALARALQAAGDDKGAATLVREVWREADLYPATEAAIRKEFPDALTRADHKARADRFFYKDNESGSLRAAALAGTDVLAMAKAREAISDKALAGLTAEMRKDPSILFARIQKLRRENKIADAAKLILDAPRDPTLLVNGDEWWVERRLIARKLLDANDPKTAYKIAAGHSAQARDQKIEAEFHAGWIALRFLADPDLAGKHFEKAASFAETPISIARAAYWQGRAAEALEKSDVATKFYETAAGQPTTYYGQLASARLGRTTLSMRQPARVATGDDRALAIRVVELIEALDQKDLAAPLAIESARKITDEGQIAALGAVLVSAKDARASLNVGKIANQRGFALDETAFPTFGIPLYEPLARSASPALVYAIARQESAFETKAQSGAGAKGLMQMLTSTARRTAQRAGVPFDESRLLNDPSFNARLGAAHLGELMGEHPGSLILTFAAYNAGGKRVKEWIAAYGDPRDANIDPVDWVERIPITETRNYVQRVAENLEVYRQRFGETGHLSIESTLRSAQR